MSEYPPRGLTGRAKGLWEIISTRSSKLTKLGWQNGENEKTTAVHPLLRIADPGWARSVADGSVFKLPFAKDGFVLGIEGVAQIDDDG